MALNVINIVGRLTKDAEVTQSSNGGKARTKFTLAVGRNYKDGQGNTPTDFIPVTIWGDYGVKISQTLRKGLQVAVNGSLQTGSYDGANGQKVYTFEVNADFVQFLEKREDNQNQQFNNNQNQQFNGGQVPPQQQQQQFNGGQQQFGGQVPPQQQFNPQQQQFNGGQQQFGGQMPPQQQFNPQQQQQFNNGGQAPMWNGQGNSGVPF